MIKLIKKKYMLVKIILRQNNFFFKKKVVFHKIKILVINKMLRIMIKFK